MGTSSDFQTLQIIFSERPLFISSLVVQTLRAKISRELVLEFVVSNQIPLLYRVLPVAANRYLVNYFSPSLCLSAEIAACWRRDLNYSHHDPCRRRRIVDTNAVQCLRS